MQAHFLVQKAVFLSSQATAMLPPVDSQYDDVVGAWRLESDGQIVVASTQPGMFPGTKKNDIETGEDQKGQ